MVGGDCDLVGESHFTKIPQYISKTTTTKKEGRRKQELLNHLHYPGRSHSSVSHVFSSASQIGNDNVHTATKNRHPPNNKTVHTATKNCHPSNNKTLRPPSTNHIGNSITTTTHSHGSSLTSSFFKTASASKREVTVNPTQSHFASAVTHRKYISVVPIYFEFLTLQQ